MMIIDQEKLVDNIIINDIIKIYPELKKLIETCSPYEVRGKILSVLDPRNDLHYDYKEFHELNLECEELKYLDEIAVTLRNYVRVADVERQDFGEVMTPITLVEEMLDTLPNEVWSNKDLKWFDPCNGVGTFPSIIVQRLMKGLKKVIPNKNKRYRHIIENMIYVCEIQSKNMFIFHCIFDRPNVFELNTFYGSFLSDEFNEHMKNVWGVEKFDIVIGNPPYNQMIDMDFVKKSYKISDKILFVHPSTWLLDEKNKQKKFTSTKELIANDLESIVLFNGNGVFGISLFVPCVITYINKNKKTKTIKCSDRINKVEVLYDHISEINKYSNLIEYPSLKNKFKNKSEIDSILNHKNILYGNNYVNVSQIRGDVKFRDRLDVGMDEIMIADSFYTIITKDIVNEKEKTKHMFFSFKTENESNNFINYLRSRVCRFALSIYKNNSQLDRGEMGLIPYLDFTQEWTDEKLYQEFNLTEEEINFINTHIPKYY
jgi:site-specific DNA-methyltransferase (adenine-specific)